LINYLRGGVRWIGLPTGRSGAAAMMAPRASLGPAPQPVLLTLLRWRCESDARSGRRTSLRVALADVLDGPPTIRPHYRRLFLESTRVRVWLQKVVGLKAVS